MIDTGKNLYDGLIKMYGDHYKDMRLDKEDMLLLCAAFAANHDVQKTGKISDETLTIIKEL